MNLKISTTPRTLRHLKSGTFFIWNKNLYMKGEGSVCARIHTTLNDKDIVPKWNCAINDGDVPVKPVRIVEVVVEEIS